MMLCNKLWLQWQKVAGVQVLQWLLQPASCKLLIDARSHASVQETRTCSDSDIEAIERGKKSFPKENDTLMCLL